MGELPGSADAGRSAEDGDDGPLPDGFAPYVPPPGTRTFKVTLEYDGTEFHGWQVQPGLRTVQGVLAEAVAAVLREEVAVFGAGRTDTGVHAKGQVASFSAATKLPASRLLRALRTKLPFDVGALALDEVADGFHARFSARGKHYRYRILTDPRPRPLLARFAHRCHFPLDLGAMRDAARRIEGTHDFRALASHRDDRPPVRTVFSVDAARRGAIVSVDVKGDGFLHHMVRTIAGTLIDVGRGARTPRSVQEAIEARDRSLAGPTAPAHGLFLVEVFYDGGAGRAVRDRGM